MTFKITLASPCLNDIHKVSIVLEINIRSCWAIICWTTPERRRCVGRDLLLCSDSRLSRWSRESGAEEKSSSSIASPICWRTSRGSSTCRRFLEAGLAQIMKTSTMKFGQSQARPNCAAASRLAPNNKIWLWRIWNGGRDTLLTQIFRHLDQDNPDSKVHGANMGPIWGRLDPGGPHVGPMNLAVWENSLNFADAIFNFCIAIAAFWVAPWTINHHYQCLFTCSAPNYYLDRCWPTLRIHINYASLCFSE